MKSLVLHFDHRFCLLAIAFLLLSLTAFAQPPTGGTGAPLQEHFVRKDLTEYVRFVADQTDPEAYAIPEYHELWEMYLNAPHPDVATMRGYFEDAAQEFSVPAPLLEAIAYVENNWTQMGPSIDLGWGAMHLVQNGYCNTLRDASTALGVDVQTLKDNARQNIRGAAALLSAYYKVTTGDDTWARWFAASARFSGLGSEKLRQIQAETYFEYLHNGVASTTVWGETFQIAPLYSVDYSGIIESARALLPEEAVGNNQLKTNDYGPAVANWAANCNYANGRTYSIDTWVNHWIGTGTYAGAISWFQDCNAQASAHFIVRSSDGQISQCVSVGNTAWHAGAVGYNNNSRSIGCEHEATAANPALWNSQPMLQASATMACHFCQNYGIPQVRNLPGIRGHGEMPGTNTACPGNLPWTDWMNLLCAPVMVPPGNDNPCSATTLTVGTSCNPTYATLIGATMSTGMSAPTCDQPMTMDVWFRLTVPAGGLVNLLTESINIPQSDCGAQFYSGSCGNLSLISGACVANGNGYMPEANNINLANYVGQTVYLRIWEFGQVAHYGDFTVCVWVPCTPPNSVTISGQHTGCNGQGVTLSATVNPTGTYTYQWSNGGNGATTTVYSSGNYTVTASSACGNVTSQSFGVTISNTPSTPYISGNPQSCNGSVTLNVGNYDPAVTYQWSNGQNGQSATFNQTGSVTVTATNICGSATSQAVNVVINQQPATPTISGNPQSCNGSVILTIGNYVQGNTYFWSNGATTQSATFTQSGIVTVMVSNPCGNATSQPVTVSIMQQPTAPMISGNPNSCNGSVVLTIANYNPAHAYVWSNGSTNQSATYTQSGVATVSANNPCGNAQSQPVTVNIQQAPTAPMVNGPQQACAGEMVTYSIVNPNPAFTYIWYNGSNGNSITVALQFNQPITVTAQNNCGSAQSQPLQVTVTPAPQMPFVTATDQNICQGQTAVLTVNNVVPGFNYVWSNGAWGASNTVMAAGTYTVTASAQGCTAQAVSQPVNIVVSQLPQPVVQLYNNLYVTGTFSAYQWMLWGNPLPGEINPTLTPQQNGSFSVVVTDNNGCTGTSAPFMFAAIDATSLEMVDVGILAGPNPTSGDLLICFQQSNTPDLTLKVYDVLGQVVQLHHISAATRDLQLNLREYPTGMYLLCFFENDQLYAVKKVLLK